MAVSGMNRMTEADPVWSSSNVAIVAPAASVTVVAALRLLVSMPRMMSWTRLK
jgi:hypothetical protein